jgi:hypothetical protein
MEELLDDLIPHCDNRTSKTFDELLDDLTSISQPQHIDESSPTVENTELRCVSTNSLHTNQVVEVSVQRYARLLASERLSTRCEHQELKQEFLKFECPAKCPNRQKCLTSGLVTLDSTAEQRLMNKHQNKLSEIKKVVVARLLGFRLVENDVRLLFFSIFFFKTPVC